MPGGIHSNKQMKYVPAKYLLYLYRNNMCSDQVKDYVSRYMDELQREVKTDGGWLRGREDQVSAQAEIIFEQLAKQNMLRFDLNQFKQDYPSLFKVIIDTAVKLKTTQP
jgi:hypothetical protein